LLPQRPSLAFCSSIQALSQEPLECTAFKELAVPILPRFLPINLILIKGISCLKAISMITTLLSSLGLQAMLGEAQVILAMVVELTKRGIEQASCLLGA